MKAASVLTTRTSPVKSLSRAFACTLATMNGYEWHPRFCALFLARMSVSHVCIPTWLRDPRRCSKAHEDWRLDRLTPNHELCLAVLYCMYYYQSGDPRNALSALQKKRPHINSRPLYGNLISTPSPCMSVIHGHICVASAALPRMLVETA